MFEQLTGRLQTTLRKLRGSAKIDEKSYGEAARELRLALLEADVHFGVVKDFLAAVKEKALGEEVTRSLTPGQQVIKIVQEELIELDLMDKNCVKRHEMRGELACDSKAQTGQSSFM